MNPVTKDSVRITADSHSGPFEVILFKNSGNNQTSVKSTFPKIELAYVWARKKLGLSFPKDLAELEKSFPVDRSENIVPEFGLDDHIFSE